jgi:MerR family transcriptional regulator, light-induced transcriptional regulator
MGVDHKNTIASQKIMEQLDTLSRNAVDRHYALQLEQWQPFQQPGYAKSLRDSGYHFSYLAEALAANDLSLFLDYIGWVKVLFTGLKFSENVIEVALTTMNQALQETLPPDLSAAAGSYIDAALAQLPNMPSTLNSNLNPDSNNRDLAASYLEALLLGNGRACSQLILDAVAQGVPVKAIYIEVFQPCMREIGLLWQTNQITVGQEHFSTAVTQTVMSQLYPYIFTPQKKRYCMVATAVGGELHAMGLRMVSDFLEMDGWDTYYLGADMPTESVLHTIAARKANLVAISATISYHVSKVLALVHRIRSTPALERVKIMVGGYPFNISEDLWRQVGADGYARDAQEAVGVANRLVGDD